MSNRNNQISRRAVKRTRRSSGFHSPLHTMLFSLLTQFQSLQHLALIWDPAKSYQYYRPSIICWQGNENTFYWKFSTLAFISGTERDKKHEEYREELQTLQRALNVLTPSSMARSMSSMMLSVAPRITIVDTALSSLSKMKNKVALLSWQNILHTFLQANSTKWWGSITCLHFTSVSLIFLFYLG